MEEKLGNFQIKQTQFEPHYFFIYYIFKNIYLDSATTTKLYSENYCSILAIIFLGLIFLTVYSLEFPLLPLRLNTVHGSWFLSCLSDHTFLSLDL